MGEFPKSRRVGVTRGITLGDRALVWMVCVGVNRGDMRGCPTLGGVAGDRDGFMSRHPWIVVRDDMSRLICVVVDCSLLKYVL